MLRPDEMLDQVLLGDGPDEEEGGGYDQERNIRVDLEVMEDPEGEVHGEHQEFAVGEVDHVHDPEDQSEADAHQGINPAHEEPADEGLSDDDPHIPFLYYFSLMETSPDFYKEVVGIKYMIIIAHANVQDF